MSNQSSDVAESLQEIAKLLLYLFEHYFAERSEEEIILCQVAFLRDTGILCDSLSILDLVALRSSQMSSQRHESDRHFSYELFYAWLRSISGLVYPSEHNSRKAFHALLTERVLPSVSRISSSEMNSNQLMLLAPKALPTLAPFNQFLRMWFNGAAAEVESDVAKDGSRSIGVDWAVALFVQSDCLDQSSHVARKQFYSVVQHLVYGGDGRLMGSVNQFWSNLSSYRLSFNELVLVMAGYVASGTGAQVDTGIIAFMKQIADNFVDNALANIVTIDEDFRSSLQGTRIPPQDPLGSSRLVFGEELWSEEYVHVHSLWCFLRQSGLMTSQRALRYMFETSMGATLACERLESVFPAARKDQKWVKSVLSTPHLLVVHAAVLDDILFALADFVSSSEPSQLKLDALRNVDSPLQAALWTPFMLLVKPVLLPRVVRYAYSPICMSELLDIFDMLEEVYQICLNKACKLIGRAVDLHSKDCVVSLQAFLEVLEDCGVTPAWIPPEACLRVCNRLCKNVRRRTDINYNYCERNNLDVILSILDVYDMCFGISQLCKHGSMCVSEITEDDFIFQDYSVVNRDKVASSLPLDFSSSGAVGQLWGNCKQLLVQIRSYGANNVATITTCSTERCVAHSGSGVSVPVAPLDSCLFDSNIAAVICSSLYAPFQPHWRGQWLLQTAVTQIPVSSFPLDSPMKCTMDVVLFCAILNYPYSAPDYTIWRLLELFVNIVTNDTPLTDKGSGVKLSPVHELCSKRMFQFLRVICESYAIRIVDILSFLQRSLLADDVFSAAAENTVASDHDFALKALSSLMLQSKVILTLSSKELCRTLRAADAALLWNYMSSCSASSFSKIIGSEDHEFSALGVNCDIVLKPVPDFVSVESGSVMMDRGAAIMWCDNLISTFFSYSEKAFVKKHSAAFLDSLHHIKWSLGLSCKGVLSVAMFSVYGVYLLQLQGGDIIAATNAWTQGLIKRSSLKLWDSSLDVTFLLSAKKFVAIKEIGNIQSIIARAVNTFDVMQTHGLPSSMVGPLTQVSAAPPRPPSKLWDAPRCVQFCRQLGVVQLIGTKLLRSDIMCSSGLIFLWKCVALALRSHYSDAKLSPWGSRDVVAPLPFNATTENVSLLLSSVAGQLSGIISGVENDGDLVAHIILGSVVPVMISFDHRVEQRSDKHGMAVDFLSARSLEDMLRFGGSKVVHTLETYYAWLIEEYRYLSGVIMPSVPLIEVSVSIAAACRYFSCGGLLKMKTSILMAGMSLNPHWRVKSVGTLLVDHNILADDYRVFAAENAKHNASIDVDVLTNENDLQVSLHEFEELFLRCAYALYEQAGCLNIANKGKVVQHGFEHCKTPEMKSYVHNYCSECEKSSVSVMNAKPTANQFVAGAWGIDFLYPFASTLQLVSSKRDRSQFQLAHASVGNYAYRPDKSVSNVSEGSSVKFTRNNIVSEILASPPIIYFRNDEKLPIEILYSLPTESHEGNSVNITDDSTSRISSARITSVPVPNSVSIVDDAIIRGRDKYLETILAARHHPQTVNNESVDEVKSPTSMQLKLSVPTRTSSGRKSPLNRASPSPRGSPRGSPRAVRSPKRQSPQSPSIAERSMGIDALLDGTKEVLWPVFATYCSCGDSMEPGKLSGPNLFALLSKLNVLTDETALSDIGVLLHQVSSHTTAQAPASTIFVPDGDDDAGLESPLLSFEEFLVFLCAFSHLRYEGTSVLPDFSGSPPILNVDLPVPVISPMSPVGDKANSCLDSMSTLFEMHGPSGETWLECWYHVMITSPSFRRLLEECVLPLLQKQALLAFPEDARHRDEYTLIFSIEILMTIQSNEHNLLSTFERHRLMDRNKGQSSLSVKSKPNHFVIAALEKIKIVPQKVSRTEVLQFVDDILPRPDKSSERELTYPQWEWVLCIVAVKAVTNALGRNSIIREAKMKNIIPFVSEVLAALAAAIVLHDDDHY